MILSHKGGDFNDAQANNKQSENIDRAQEDDAKIKLKKI